MDQARIGFISLEPENLCVERYPYSFPTLNSIPKFSISSMAVVQEGRLQSVHHTLSLPVFPPHTLPLIQCGISPVEDNLPWYSPTWVLPMGFISSLNAPSWVFFPRPQICQVCQQTYPSTKSYLHEAIGPTRSMLWHEFSYFWTFPCSSMGSCKCSRWTSALWAGGAQLPHHGLYQRLQRYLCSSAHFPPSLYWSWGFQGSFSHIFSLTSQLQLPQCSNASPFLKSVFPAALLLSQMSSALCSCWTIRELDGTGSIRHWRSFFQLLSETTPVALLSCKPNDDDVGKNYCCYYHYYHYYYEKWGKNKT